MYLHTKNTHFWWSSFLQQQQPLRDAAYVLCCVQTGQHRRHSVQKVTVFKQIIVLKCRYCNLSFLLQSCFRFGDPDNFRLKWQHITESWEVGERGTVTCQQRCLRKCSVILPQKTWRQWCWSARPGTMQVEGHLSGLGSKSHLGLSFAWKDCRGQES